MLFHEKLNFLMNLTDITNSKLAKDANIDPSLISRWRRGIKTPSLHSDAVFCIARVLSLRLGDDFRKTKFAQLSNSALDSLSSANAITRSIQEWFAIEDNISLKKTLKPLHRKPHQNYYDRQLSPLDSLSVAESYCGGKEGRIAALKWAMSFVKHWSSGGTLRFYTDQSPDWLDVDYSFFKKIAKENAKHIDIFSIVKILMPVNSPAANHSQILEFAKLFMDTATVSINYVRQNERSIFQHSFGIYEDHIALSCCGFYGGDYLATRLHSDESFIHCLTNDFESNFNSAEVALRYMPRFTIWDLCRTYAGIFTHDSDVYYRSSQIFLPFVPSTVICEILDDTDDGLDALGFDYIRLSQLLKTFLKSNTLFVSISFKSLCLSAKKSHLHPCLFIQDDQKIFFTANQCKAILENILSLLETFDNLILVIEDEPFEDFFLVQEKIQLLYARINDKMLPYQSHHPHFVQVTWKNLAENLASSIKKYNRTAVKNRLRDVIKTIEKDDAPMAKPRL